MAAICCFLCSQSQSAALSRFHAVVQNVILYSIYVLLKNTFQECYSHFMAFVPAILMTTLVLNGGLGQEHLDTSSLGFRDALKLLRAE